MILKEDLKNISKFLNLSLFQTQVIYYQSIVLQTLSKYSLAFKGGTALWFCYGLSRFSEDLDFTLTGDLKINKLLKEIIRDLTYFGASAEIKKIFNKNESLTFRIDIDGLLYSGKLESKVYLNVDISKRENAILELNSCRINLEYFKIPEFFVRTLSLEEIFAEKIRAIYTREKGRDLYDLYFLINKKVKFKESLVNEKLSFYNVKFNKNNFLSKIKNAKKYYEKDIKSLTNNFIEYDVVNNKILSFFK